MEQYLAILSLSKTRFNEGVFVDLTFNDLQINTHMNINGKAISLPIKEVVSVTIAKN